MLTKYRAYDKETKKVYPVTDLDFTRDGQELLGVALRMEPAFIPMLSADRVVLMQSTGMVDENENEIYSGDLTELDVDGEKRLFEVQIRQVVRKVKSHPDFYDEYAKVAIQGVVFLWEGYELFPCIDGQGVIDTSRMRIVGNIYENSELLEVSE